MTTLVYTIQLEHQGYLSIYQASQVPAQEDERRTKDMIISCRLAGRLRMYNYDGAWKAYIQNAGCRCSVQRCQLFPIQIPVSSHVSTNPSLFPKG